MSWLTATDPKVEEAKQAASHREAVDREIEEASKGGIAALRARRDELKAEAPRVQEALVIAMALEERDPSTHGDERRRLQQRGRDLRTITAAVENKLGALRRVQARKQAESWNQADGTAALVNDYLCARVASLAPVASLLASYEAESSTGAAVRQMLPLPTDEVAALRSFVAYVQGLQRMGVKVDSSSWPASVRDRVVA